MPYVTHWGAKTMAEELEGLQTWVNRQQGMASDEYTRHLYRSTGYAVPTDCIPISIPTPVAFGKSPKPKSDPKPDFHHLHTDAFHALLDTFRAIAK
jgi:hypothetical protein